MYGNEPDYHEAHIRVRFSGGDSNYSISDGRKLNGSIEDKYDKRFQDWIAQNQAELKQCWDEIKDGLAGRKPKTAWWGNDEWQRDVSDDSSPAACTLTLIPNALVSKGAEDSQFEVSADYQLYPSRFVAIVVESTLSIGEATIDTSAGSFCWKFKTREDIEIMPGGALEAPVQYPLAVLGTNDMKTLTATLQGISLDQLKELSAA